MGKIENELSRHIMCKKIQDYTTQSTQIRLPSRPLQHDLT